MTHSIIPSEQAERLRERAATVSGPDRDYYIWLALEWERSEARYRHVPTRPRQKSRLGAPAITCPDAEGG